jgi:hypothetical protein
MGAAARDIDEAEAAAASKAPKVPTIPNWERLGNVMASIPIPGRASLSARLSRDQKSVYLPAAHPQTAREAGDLTAAPTVCFSPVRSKPYNTLRKFEKLANKSNEGAYAGQRTDGVYLSERERQIKLEYQDRQKFRHLHPRGFQLCSPTHVIPLREMGHVRGDGIFPETPKNQGFEHMTASDYAMLRLEDKEKHIGGHWKRS